MLHSKKHSNPLMNTQIHPRLMKEGPLLTANPVRGRIHCWHTIALRTKARHRVLATKGMTISLAQPLPQLPRTQTSLPRPPPPQDRLPSHCQQRHLHPNGEYQLVASKMGESSLRALFR